MKIAVFGVGQIYNLNKAYMGKDDEIIALLDNNPRLWGTKIDGITIYNPDDISNLSYDKIVLMSVHALEMKHQLWKAGCDRRKIERYIEYFKRIQSKRDLEKIHSSSWCKEEKSRKKQGLIITTALDYNGGSMAAVYAAIALQKKGYEITIAAPKGVDDFIKEMEKKGIHSILYTNLSHACEEELYWTNDYRFVLVNTLQMICCAIAVAGSRKVLLWLHEPKKVYEFMNYWDEEIREGILLEKLNICAVSSIAKQNFLDRYFVKSMRLLPYGIPDERTKEVIGNDRPLTFAVIGHIQYIKGQDIFLDAIENLDYKGSFPVFKIIGRNTNDEYGRMINERVKKYSNVYLLGEMTHNEIIKINQTIDVLVISSREETMSIVATEAMMLGKVCIISDSSGMASYIDTYRNGLIFSTEKSEDLAEKIMWCMDNQEKLGEIGWRARETYEAHFSMDMFGDHLIAMLNG
jgi:glycosyltransferase involved in cell wall biosynthesis